MQAVIVFLKNVWNAQRNAAAVARWERTFETHTLINDILANENAALRKQVSQRDASGKFTKKSPS